MRITFSVSLAAATAYSRLGESDMHEKGFTDPSVNEATTADVDILFYSALLLFESHLLSCEHRKGRMHKNWLASCVEASSHFIWIEPFETYHS